MPAKHQTALFSATMAPRIAAIAKRHLHDATRITIAAERAPEGTEARVREVAYVVQRRHKLLALARILDMEDPAAALVFCRTRNEVDELTETLRARGYGAESLHGGIAQEGRDRVLRRFREGAAEVLVATDVAARGLDIDHLSHVINYDLPASADAYTHRVGRTGRAGREGVAITLVEPRETGLLRNIATWTKRKIVTETVPTVHDLRGRRLEVTRTALLAALEGDAADGPAFTAYRDLATRLSTDHSLLDIAAAALKLADEAREGTSDDDVDIPQPAPLLAKASHPGQRGAMQRNDGVRKYVSKGRQIEHSRR
jgi:ATP-dependent RNA helicase DeaD